MSETIEMEDAMARRAMDTAPDIINLNDEQRSSNGGKAKPPHDSRVTKAVPHEERQPGESQVLHLQTTTQPGYLLPVQEVDLTLARQIGRAHV